MRFASPTLDPWEAYRQNMLRDNWLKKQGRDGIAPELLIPPDKEGSPYGRIDDSTKFKKQEYGRSNTFEIPDFNIDMGSEYMSTQGVPPPPRQRRQKELYYDLWGYGMFEKRPRGKRNPLYFGF